MTVNDMSNNLANNNRRKLLDTVRVKLLSHRPSDIFSAMLIVRKWLQENIEDQEVYEILLDAVNDNHEIRQEVRNLLDEMVKAGSKSAAGALRILPADIKDWMADADDAYYTGDYEQAINLYRQVLEREPANILAREQLAKAELNRIAGMPDTGLPRAAIQQFRRARSHIAARDFVAATNLLSSALDIARAKGMDFPEAENLINSIQDLWTADEYKAKAHVALKDEQWGIAWDLYKKASLLNPQDQVVKEFLDALDGLLRADALLDSLDDQQIGMQEHKEKLEKIDNFLKRAEEIKDLVGTTLLKKSRRRYNRYRGVGLKTFISTRPNQIVTIIIVFFVIAVLSLIWREWIVEDPNSQSLITPSMLPVLFTETPTNTSSPTPSRTITPKLTNTSLPTGTFTQTLEPTPIVEIGFGKLTKTVFTFEEPGGNTMDEILPQGLFISCIMDKVNRAGFTYYKCNWKYHDNPDEGWIIGNYIQFDPTLTPLPQ